LRTKSSALIGLTLEDTLIERILSSSIFDGDIIDTEKLKKEIGNIHISFRLNKEGRPETYLNDVNVEDKIRSMSVSSKVSPISALDFVRKEMVAQQQSSNSHSFCCAMVRSVLSSSKASSALRNGLTSRCWSM